MKNASLVISEAALNCMNAEDLRTHSLALVREIEFLERESAERLELVVKREGELADTVKRQEGTIAQMRSVQSYLETKHTLYRQLAMEDSLAFVLGEVTCGNHVAKKMEAMLSSGMSTAYSDSAKIIAGALDYDEYVE